MPHSPIISKENDQEAQKPMVDLDHETKHAPSESQNIVQTLPKTWSFPTCCHSHICLQEKPKVGNH